MKKWHAILVAVLFLSLCGYFCWPSILLAGTKYYIKYKFDEMSPQVKSTLYRIPEKTLIITQKKVDGPVWTGTLGKYRLTLPQPVFARLNGRYYDLNYPNYTLKIKSPSHQDELKQIMQTINCNCYMDLLSKIFYTTPNDLQVQNNIANVERTTGLLTMKIMFMPGKVAKNYISIFDRGDIQGYMNGDVESDNVQIMLVDIYLPCTMDVGFLLFENTNNTQLSDVIDLLSTIQIEPLDKPSTAPATSSSPATSQVN